MVLDEEAWAKLISSRLAECLSAALTEAAARDAQGADAALIALRKAMDRTIETQPITLNVQGQSIRSVARETNRRMQALLDAIEEDARMKLGLPPRSRVVQ